MFETNIPRHPLPVVTDSYADKVGDPAACGEREYRMVYRGNSLNPVNFYFEDMTTQEYWFEFNNHLDYAPRTYGLLLEVKLVDYPEVTPMFQYFLVKRLCSDLHHSIYNSKNVPTSLEYDITEAGKEEYDI